MFDNGDAFVILGDVRKISPHNDKNLLTPYKDMKKLLYMLPALLVLATTMTSCAHRPRTTTRKTVYVITSPSKGGYAPSSVYGRVIKCGNIRYKFNGNGNSFYYNGSLVRYVKTGRNTASIYDYDDNLHHRITFTSSSGGYTASGRSVYMYWY